MLRTKSAAEWLERLEAEGVPCAPVLTRSEVIRHPQVMENAIVVETDHPVAGRLRQARLAARFSGTPTSIRRGAPRLGEDTESVLKQLGYAQADIDALAAAGVIGLSTKEPAE